MGRYPVQPDVKPADPAHLPAEQEFDVFDKLDGHRLLVCRGTALRRARHINLWSRLPAPIRDRIGTDWLDGELVTPDLTPGSVQTALAGDGAGLDFRPFGLVGCDADAAAQARDLAVAGFNPPTYLGRYTGAAVAALWPQWRERVHEGVVLRPVGGGDWLKLKRVATEDLLIVGVVPGTGRWAGLNSGVLCALPDGRTVAVHAGLTARQIVSLTTAAVGLYAEIGSLGRTSAGLLREPRFIRFRHDLPRHWSVAPHVGALPDRAQLLAWCRAACRVTVHLAD